MVNPQDIATQTVMDALATLANSKLAPGTPYAFGSTATDWLTQINRMRTDLWTQIFSTPSSAIYLNPDTLVSGIAWCVGLNVPVTFPMCIPKNMVGGLSFDMNAQGELWGTLNASSTVAPNPNFTGFKSVKFYFSAADAPDGLTVATGRRVDCFVTDGGLTTAESFDFPFNASLGGAVLCALQSQFAYSGAGAPPALPPDATAFGIVDTSSVPITWTTVALATAGQYLLVGTINYATIGSGAGNITFSATAPANYSFPGTASGGGIDPDTSLNTLLVSSKLYFSEENTITIPAVIHQPSSMRWRGQVIAADDIPADSDFTVNGNYSIAMWEISDPTVPGMWTAMTLPVPGVNVFLDQDLPPYVGQISESGEVDDGNPVSIALPLNRSDRLSEPQASTMRQPAPINLGSESIVPADPKINPVAPGINARGTKWWVIRDTDAVVYNPLPRANQDIQIFTSITLPPGGIFSTSFPIVPTNATAVKMRLIKPGSGTFYNPPTISQNLNFYVSISNSADPSDPSTYDFETSDSQVNIPTDGGAGYLASIIAGESFVGFNYSIKNPTDAPVTFDLFTELDYGVGGARVFTAAVHECFSYCIEGDAPGVGSSAGYTKPIPQNGYCIWKIRASRPIEPVNGYGVTPESGAAITATIGQNKVQGDGSLLFTPLSEDGGVTPFTITIAADARDSGDVAVFWPVLSGTELVWQCDSTIVLEAWANWQPVFFSTYMGIFKTPDEGTIPLNAFNPTEYSQALAFSNRFQITYANYPATAGNVSTTVQFPLFAGLYNDLEAVLNLM